MLAKKCALCHSTWGNYYETVENEKLFFCCDVCATIFKEIILKLKKIYNITTIETLSLEGTPRIRTYKVISNGQIYEGTITFSHGSILAITNMIKTNN